MESLELTDSKVLSDLAPAESSDPCPQSSSSVNASSEQPKSADYGTEKVHRSASPASGAELQRWRRELTVIFEKLASDQYDTSVDPASLEADLEGHLSDDVYFHDPWQAGGGKDWYLLGQRGFHAMLRFHLKTHQLAVDIDEPTMTARVMVDSVMVLEQLRPLITYPLRTFLVYKVKLERPNSPDLPLGWKIFDHEEMWSLSDMLENVPGFGWGYNWFRYAFSRGFLLASKLAVLLRGR